MATAVLLPQDCLSTSKNRHKSHLSEAIFQLDRTSRARKGNPQESVLEVSTTVSRAHSRRNSFSSRVEWTPKSAAIALRGNGADSHTSGSQREVDGRKSKARKSFEVSENKSDSKLTCDAPALKILQRPKNKDAADELIMKVLAKVDGDKVPEGECSLDLNLDSSETQTGTREEHSHYFFEKRQVQSGVCAKLSEGKLSGPKSKKGSYFTKVQEFKILDASLISSKLADKDGRDLYAVKGQYQNEAPITAEPVNVARRGSLCGFDEVMHLKGLSEVASLKLTSEHRNLKKAGSSECLRSKLVHRNQPVGFERTVPSGLPRLKRAATDPQIVKQFAGHYRSKEVNIPFSEAKSCHGFPETTPMSCPERWAGPSYYSSPAPSSLPLPKFFLPSQRISSVQSPMEGHIRNRPQFPDPELSSPMPSPPQGGALDVAFATKSLRKMLKLDPF